jgi:hypothetical protein
MRRFVILEAPRLGTRFGNRLPLMGEQSDLAFEQGDAFALLDYYLVQRFNDAFQVSVARFQTFASLVKRG